MTKRLTVLLGLTAALCVMAPGAAFADPGRVQAPDYTRSGAPVMQASPYMSIDAAGDVPMNVAAVSISPSQAKAIALRANPGAEYLNIRLIGGKTYFVRLLLTNGTRHDIKVDARTGRIVG